MVLNLISKHIGLGLVRNICSLNVNSDLLSAVSFVFNYLSTIIYLVKVSSRSSLLLWVVKDIFILLAWFYVFKTWTV